MFKESQVCCIHLFLESCKGNVGNHGETTIEVFPTSPPWKILDDQGHKISANSVNYSPDHFDPFAPVRRSITSPDGTKCVTVFLVTQTKKCLQQISLVPLVQKNMCTAAAVLANFSTFHKIGASKAARSLDALSFSPPPQLDAETSFPTGKNCTRAKNESWPCIFDCVKLTLFWCGGKCF